MDDICDYLDSEIRACRIEEHSFVAEDTLDKAVAASSVSVWKKGVMKNKRAVQRRNKRQN
jgi:hypothetical protein